MKTNENPEVFICDCHSTDHQIIFLYDEYIDEINGKKYSMCYAHIHLNERSFWYRVKYGIKYIFGYKCRYGAFDEFIFNPSDADRLQDLVDYLRKQNRTENVEVSVYNGNNDGMNQIL